MWIYKFTGTPTISNILWEAPNVTSAEDKFKMYLFETSRPLQLREIEVIINNINCNVFH